jgi:hypothetical protein
MRISGTGSPASAMRSQRTGSRLAQALRHIADLCEPPAAADLLKLSVSASLPRSWPVARAVGSELRYEINGNVLHIRCMLRDGIHLGPARGDCLVGLGRDGPILQGQRRVAVRDRPSGFGDTGECLPALRAGREPVGVYGMQEGETRQPVGWRVGHN